MMDLLQPDRVLLLEKSSTSKHLLGRIAELLAGEHASQQLVKNLTQALIARETIGSTGLGNGVAMPHARLKELPGPTAAFVRLKQGIVFDANQTEPVDLFFAIATPEIFVEPHLKLMGEVASFLDDPRALKSLRLASNSETLFQRINHWFLEAA